MRQRRTGHYRGRICRSRGTGSGRFAPIYVPREPDLTPPNFVPPAVGILAHMPEPNRTPAMMMRFELQLYYCKPECLGVTGTQTVMTHNSVGEPTEVEIDFDAGQLRTNFLLLFEREQALSLALNAASEAETRRLIRRSMTRVNRRFQAVSESEGRVPNIFRLYVMLLPYLPHHRDERDRALVAALLYGLALNTGHWPHPLIREMYDIPARSKTLDRWFQDARRYNFLLPPNNLRDRPKTARERSDAYWEHMGKKARDELTRTQ